MAARRRNPDMVANALMRRVSNVPRFDAEARILHRIDEMDTRLTTGIKGYHDGVDDNQDYISRRIDVLTTRIDEMDTRLNARIDMLGTHLTASLDDMKATFTVEYVCYKFCIYCY